MVNIYEQKYKQINQTEKMNKMESTDFSIKVYRHYAICTQLLAGSLYIQYKAEMGTNQ